MPVALGEWSAAEVAVAAAPGGPAAAADEAALAPVADQPRWLSRLWLGGPALAALVLAGIAATAGGGGGPLWWAGTGALTALAHLGRERWPVGAWALSLVVVAGGALQPTSGAYLLLLLVPVLPLVALASARPPRTSLAAAVVTPGVTYAIGVVLGAFDLAGGALVLALAVGTTASLPAGAWLAGYALYTRRRYAAGLLQRAAWLERERDANAARAVAEERTRIARDLHDVVSHNVAVMVVQAAAADAVWDADPVRARAAVRAVEDTGRTAMGELRAMLGAMRGGDDEATGAERRAQDGLRRLPALVEQVRATGLDARLEVRGDPGRVPAAVGVSLLRVAQEALTNALRHADATAVTVTVVVEDDHAALTVEDDGRGVDGSRRAGEPADPTRRGGHGLVGMRERVAVLGGRLDVGAGHAGGTRVAAAVPLRQDPPR